jgi:phosphoserine phosphatase RsbU/P
MTSDARRIPLAALYALLGVLLVWAVVYRVRASMDVAAVVFRADAEPSLAFLTGWPEGRIEFLPDDIAKRSDPVLLKGDRVVSIDGSAVRTPSEAVRAVLAADPHGVLRVVVERSDGAGVARTFTSTIQMRSVAEGNRRAPLAFLALVLGLFMPWVCTLVGGWVGVVRPRDPMAWLVLALLLAFAQIGSFQQFMYLAWPAPLQFAAALYVSLASSTWPIWLALFGVHFAGRLAWEARRPWVTPLVLAPFTALVAAGFVVDVGAALDARGLAPLARTLSGAAGIGQLTAMLTISYFFLVLGWKAGRTREPDAKRRIRLLVWGSTVALTPLLAIAIALRITGGPLEALSPWFFVPCLLAIVIFPLTLAYVIVVERAMDVRVVVRQGIKYGATRGAIRVLVVLAIAAVMWNAWNLVNDPDANRPRKLQAIAWGMVVALWAPRAAKKMSDWTDRRFFREAYDAERVLTELSEEVRTFVETGPLIDTVLERIGTTLHVDRAIAFLMDGDHFSPKQVRGGVDRALTSFEASGDLARRLAETGRPLRVRHDDPESPLRRSQIAGTDRLRLDDLEAELVLPLLGKRDLLGFIVLGPKRSEEPYTASDAKLLGSVATQAGLALENSRLTATIAHEIARRERMSREIEIARDVQMKLFPQAVPRLPGLDCAGHCRPAQGVGGDYYDFLVLPGPRLGVALGDVAGKGIPAALLMASLQASLRGQRLSGPSDLAQLMVNLNRLIYEASPDNRYATFFYGELDPVTRRLDYVNAGHNAPMLFRGESGSIERLAASGPVIGLLDAGRFEQRSITLAPGDLLLVFSDGISEAMNAGEEEWGESRLLSAVREAGPCPAEPLIHSLFAAADAFAGGAVQYDDMTVVVVRVEA